MGYDSVLAALDSWDAQTRDDALEIIVLCPNPPDTPPRFNHIILDTGSMLLHEARAAGVRRAAADYVILAEDHCLPDPDCVEQMLQRLDEGWDGVGPALRAGHFKGAIAPASFLIGYGQWMLPPGGKVEHLPGHNPALRRQPLIDMGAELEEELFQSFFLMRRLRLAGLRFYVEPRARMRHFDSPSLRRSIEIFFTVGKGSGAVRLKNASVAGRLLYGIATPLTAARHFGRGFIHYARAGRRAKLGPQTLVATAFFGCVWAIGETAGAWSGIAGVSPSLWRSEIKPVSREQALRADRPGGKALAGQ